MAEPNTLKVFRDDMMNRLEDSNLSDEEKWAFKSILHHNINTVPTKSDNWELFNAHNFDLLSHSAQLSAVHNLAPRAAWARVKLFNTVDSPEEGAPLSLRARVALMDTPEERFLFIRKHYPDASPTHGTNEEGDNWVDKNENYFITLPDGKKTFFNPLQPDYSEETKEPLMKGYKSKFDLGDVVEWGEDIAHTAGSIAGGATALVTGVAGPQAAIPEEIWTIPLYSSLGGQSAQEIYRTALKYFFPTQDKKGTVDYAAEDFYPALFRQMTQMTGAATGERLGRVISLFSWADPLKSLRPLKPAIGVTKRVRESARKIDEPAERWKINLPNLGARIKEPGFFKGLSNILDKHPFNARRVRQGYKDFVDSTALAARNMANRLRGRPESSDTYNAIRKDEVDIQRSLIEGVDIGETALSGMNLRWDKLRKQYRKLYEDAFKAVPEDTMLVPNKIKDLQDTLQMQRDGLSELPGTEAKFEDAMGMLNDILTVSKENRQKALFSGVGAVSDTGEMLGGIPIRAMHDWQSTLRELTQDIVKNKGRGALAVRPITVKGKTMPAPIYQLRDAILEDIDDTFEKGIVKHVKEGDPLHPDTISWSEGEPLYRAARKLRNWTHNEFEKPLEDFLVKQEKLPLFTYINNGSKEGNEAVAKIYKGLTPEHRLIASSQWVDRLGRRNPASTDPNNPLTDFNIVQWAQDYDNIANSTKDIMFGKRFYDGKNKSLQVLSQYRRDLDEMSGYMKEITQSVNDPDDIKSISDKAMRFGMMAVPFAPGVASGLTNIYLHGEYMGPAGDQGNFLDALNWKAVLSLTVAPVLASRMFSNPKIVNWMLKEAPEDIWKHHNFKRAMARFIGHEGGADEGDVDVISDDIATLRAYFQAINDILVSEAGASETPWPINDVGGINLQNLSPETKQKIINASKFIQTPPSTAGSVIRHPE
jgi:hypothetical protein